MFHYAGVTDKLVRNHFLVAHNTKKVKASQLKLACRVCGFDQAKSDKVLTQHIKAQHPSDQFAEEDSSDEEIVFGDGSDDDDDDAAAAAADGNDNASFSAPPAQRAAAAAAAPKPPVESRYNSIMLFFILIEFNCLPCFLDKRPNPKF